MSYVSKHIAVSVSISSNVPDFENDEFILSEDPKLLCKEMFKYFDKLSLKAKELMLRKMSPLIDKIKNYTFSVQEKQNIYRKNKYLEQVESYCSIIPILGFNSSFYDINLLTNEGFIHEILARDSNPFVLKEGNRYKVIKTFSFMFLDQMSYCAAGTSLSGFINAYNVGEQKGWFPYEWFDNFSKLDFPVKDLLISDFYSSLKNETMSEKDFKKLQQIYKENNIQTVKDLLKWYNNLDVRPMLKACLKQKEFFYDFNLDMYKDAFSLPALSENILYQSQLEGFEEYVSQKVETWSVLRLDDDAIQERIYRYDQQDKDASRDNSNNVSVNDVRELLKREKNRCYYCWWGLNEERIWTLDRIDCLQSHTKENCVVACAGCNKSRSNKIFKEFYRHKALLRWEKEHPMIWLFSEKNKDVFYKLKNNIVGGASIVFHRYHEKDKTQITRTHYNAETKEWSYQSDGKVVQKIQGFDANALYLWCLGEEIPCGKLFWQDTDDWSKYREEVLMDKFFGFLEVDIEVPEDKYNYFSEMCPLFVNKEYDENVCGQCTNDLLYKLDRKPTKSRKLIATLKTEKIWLKSTRLRWMIQHGCVMTKLHGVIPAKPRRLFKDFVERISNERRKGDADPKYKVIGNNIKDVGNTAFGRTAMDKNKHKKIKFCNEIQFNRAKNNYFYYDAEVYSIDQNTVYEVIKKPKTVNQNMPIHIAASVFDDSKLKILQFYYDCIDKYVDRSDFQYIEMDTDSAYMALTNDFDKLIRPELRSEYERDRHNWFPRTDTKEHEKFDKRTPGLFKTEYEGDGMVALCSKTYYVWSEKENKVSSKGLQQRRNQETLTKEKYLKCLFNKETIDGTNKGFRVFNNSIQTYQQNKIGLSPLYTKAVVMEDGIHIRPILF